MRPEQVRFQGWVVLPVQQERRTQATRVQHALQVAEQQRASGTKAVLNKTVIDRVLSRFPTRQLVHLLTGWHHQGTKQAITWNAAKTVATVDYGEDKAMRRKLQEALSTQGASFVDTEGDLLSPTTRQAQREAFIATLYRSLEQEVGELLKAQGKTVATAESCTGGLASSRLTDISGSSDYVRHNIVTYCNQAKSQALGIPADRLAQDGPYNETTAAQMATGIRQATGCDIGLAYTGLVSPSGQNGVPGGTVFIGLAGLGDHPVTKRVHIDPTKHTRPEIKQIFTEYGLFYLKQYLLGQLT